MGAINSTVRINDGMSSAMRSMNKALSIVLSSFEKLQSLSGNAIDTADIKDAQAELSKVAIAVSEIEDAFNEVENGLDGASKKIKEANDGFTTMKGIVANIAANAISRAADGIKQSISSAIDYASDLAEVQNVLDVTFGKNSSVNEWAKGTLEAVGLNELSAKRYAGTMGAMLKSSGIANDYVEEMSKNLTELSGDMASFYNLEAEDAFAKIRSGISGETEPLKALGINMSVANLEAYALSKGIKKAYKSMSQAEQVTLRYNYLLSTTSDAQGDFKRTSQSFANQQKLLSENWLQLTGAIADDLIPALTNVLIMLNTIIEKVSGFNDKLNGVPGIVLGAVAAFIAYEAILYAISKASVVAKVAQLGLNDAIKAFPAIAVFALGMKFLDWFIDKFEEMEKEIGVVSSRTSSAAGAIVGMFTWAGALIGNVIITGINLVIDAIAFVWNFVAMFANFFANVFNDPLGSLARLFFDVVDFILGLLELVASAIDTIFGSKLSDAVSGWRSSLDGWVSDTFGEEQVVMAKFDMSKKLDRFDLSDAYWHGMDIGNGLAGAGSVNGEPDAGQEVVEEYEAMLNALEGIDDNVTTIADALEMTDEDLKYLRDYAEREAINRFTTAEIKVDFTSNNSISNSADVDGILDYFEERLLETMETAAEGVY